MPGMMVERVFFASDDIVSSFGKCYDELFIATKSTKRHEEGFRRKHSPAVLAGLSTFPYTTDLVAPSNRPKMGRLCFLLSREESI
jgi:hypothetical protein